MRTIRNIAVVAVHGVGEHEPHTSAAAISRLLLRLPRALGGRYTSFAESPIAIPVEPVPEARTKEEAKNYRTKKRPTDWSTLDERPERPGMDDKIPEGIRFMRDQLHDYRASANGSTYESVRFEGRHLAAADSKGAESSEPDARLHVYEMYWSDIRRIGNSVFAIFGAFYQVIIHLPYLGLITLEEAHRASGSATSSAWPALLRTYRWTLRLMTLFAPVLNMVMLAIALSSLVRVISPDWRRNVAVVLSGLMLAGIWSRGIYLAGKARSLWRIALMAVVSVAVIVGGFFVDGPLSPTVALIGEAWVLLALPLYLLFRLFERNRPGARVVGVVTWAIASAAGLALALGFRQNPTTIVVGSLELLNVLLLGTWLGFGILLLLVVVLGWIVVRNAAVRVDELKRAAYTARFALTFPAIAFAIVTLAFWGALVAGVSGQVFEKGETYTPLLHYPLLTARQQHDRTEIANQFQNDSVRLATKASHALPWEQRGLADSLDAVHRRKADASRALNSPGYFLRVFGGASDGLPGLVAVALIGIAFLLVLWMLVPVLATEFRSPTLDETNRRNEKFPERSKRLGYWLTTAFRVAKVSGAILVLVSVGSIVAILLMFPVFPLGPRALEWLEAPFGYTEVGAWLLGASVGTYAVFSRLSSLGAKLRPVFGIMADVDNYLRELPTDHTPRAQIAERYTSLLRYLCRWRTEGDTTTGYDAIVIVAHSQGTVITADLLRFLGYSKCRRRDFEPHLDRLGRSDGTMPETPIILLTMGCPLRQLYMERFPELYRWVADPSTYLGRPDCSAGKTLDPEREQPLLGVTAWINLYRSGDYVGRNVDEPEDPKSLYEPNRLRRDRTPGFAEACIGPGAHTHYWDESAEVVARVLDSVTTELILKGDSAQPIDAALAVIEARPADRNTTPDEERGVSGGPSPVGGVPAQTHS